MAVQHKYQDWSVTSEKVVEAVRRIVELLDLLRASTGHMRLVGVFRTTGPKVRLSV
ncbi:MAG TPA: hypothetical protein VI320_28945 [Terracidiphilus sp.]|jgi:hypothetical protein